jgi:hypothetical protein
MAVVFRPLFDVIFFIKTHIRVFQGAFPAEKRRWMRRVAVSALMHSRRNERSERIA